MSYQRAPQDPYPPPGYNPYSPPATDGYPSAPPPPSFEGYPPPGYPAFPPQPSPQPPYEGYQGYFAQGYPPPPPGGGHPQYQQCQPQYERYDYQEDQSGAGCFSFLQGCCQILYFKVQWYSSFHASETLHLLQANAAFSNNRLLIQLCIVLEGKQIMHALIMTDELEELVSVGHFSAFIIDGP
ncbi:hypothetical protein V6N13_083889 [Hibiscus sabdariffa]